MACLPGGTAAYSPDAESALEHLRDRVSAGQAGQEAYDAFLDFLADRPDDGCQAWAETPETGDGDLRWREIGEAMAAVCPDLAVAGGETAPGNMEDTLHGSLRDREPKALLALSQTARPRQNPDAAGGQPSLLRAKGSLPGLAGRLSLRDYRMETRFLRVGAPRFSLLAGHLHAAQAETRLGFVVGSRFYAGWSGSSGIEGALGSPETALDGLGLRARAGKWILEAAATWNRLHRAAISASSASIASPARNDAVLLAAGAAGRLGAVEAGWDFRAQAARQRFEPDAGPATEVSIAGASLANRAQNLIRWNLGLAASYTDAPPPSGASAGPGRKAGNGTDQPDWGGYLEAALASPDADSAGWRLQLRQADAGWANPLQSPRGYLRDTLDGRWILPGRGEGGLSARTRFPLAAWRGYRARIDGGGGADWGLDQGLVAGEGNLAVIQILGEWTHEAGATAAFLRAGSRGPGSSNGSGGGTQGRGGWGQSLAWRRGDWAVKTAFTWKGGGYSGSLPAPLSIECRRMAAMAWSAAFLMGDMRSPGNYLRCDVRQGWKLENRLQIEQALRIPWTREGLANDLGYQLRLTAAL